MRLNQFIARHTGVSRRQADEIIRAGEVKVNGDLAIVGYQIELTDTIEIKDATRGWMILTNFENEASTILLFKPVFTVSSKDDPRKRRTIYDILPPVYHNFKMAGRLHYMSEGLIILSLDGSIIHSLTHTDSMQIKQYVISLGSKLTPEDIQEAKKGLVINGYLMGSVSIEPIDSTKYPYLSLNPKEWLYEVTVNKGGNIQLRTWLDSIKNSPRRLIKVRHGEYKISEELLQRKWLIL